MTSLRFRGCGALLALVSGMSGADPAAVSDAVAVAPVLLAARFYAWGAVGTPAAVSAEELAARAAYRRASLVQLTDGLSKATPEGQLYLLCILRKRDAVQYGRVRAGWRPAPGLEVSTFEGNVLRRERALDIVAQFERSGCAPLDWPGSAPEASPVK